MAFWAKARVMSDGVGVGDNSWEGEDSRLADGKGLVACLVNLSVSRWF